MSEAGYDVINHMPTMATKLNDFIASFAEMLAKLIESRRDNAAIRELLQSLSDGKGMSCLFCKDFAVRDFENEMKAFGCPVVTGRVSDGPNKGLIMCMFREEDTKFALICREQAMTKAGIDGHGKMIGASTEIGLATMHKMAEQNRSRTFAAKDLNEAQAKIFAGELHANRVVYARKTWINEKGETRTDFYFSDDKEKAEKSYAKMQIAFSGISGNYKNQQVMSELQAAKQALSAFENNKDHEFYVVSKNNPYNRIHVTNTSVSHKLVGGDKPFTYRLAGGKERNSDFVNLRKVYKQEVATITNPVVLSKDEYLKGLDDPDYMEELLKEKSPSITYRDKNDKQNAYIENFFKAKFTQMVYRKERAGCFDPEKELQKLEDCNTLAQYFDNMDDFTGLDGFDPEFEIEQMEAVQSMENSLSPEVAEEVKAMIGEFVEKYQDAETEVFYEEIDPDEVSQSLDEMLEDIHNNKTFAEIPDHQREQEYDDEE